MANSILNSDDGSVSGSAGLKFTAGDDGVLKIQNNGTDALTVSDAGVVTFAQQLVNPVPAFRAYLNTDQSVTSGTPTIVNIDSVTGNNAFDTNNWFNTATYRYIPQIAGYYQFNGSIRATGTNITRVICLIYKNGAFYEQGETINCATTSSAQHCVASALVYLNGTTDYVQIGGNITATSPAFDVATGSEHATCFLSGFLVRAA